MNQYKLLISIVRRDQGEDYLDFFHRCGVATSFASLCKGTASKSMLDYLGLEKTEKIMLQSMINGDNAGRLLRRLVTQMGIDLPGNGIAMTIPVGSIGGRSGLDYLAHGQDAAKREEKEVKKVSEIPYVLIIAIADKGTTDLVMDAARSAGARGGTVISARGTGEAFTQKFFGVSIAAEKELVYIVSRKSDKEKIMRAIMDQAGIHTDAHGVVFALPVDSVAGLRSVTQDDDPDDSV